MKMHVKRIICAIFAFCLLTCAFSACGKKSGDGSSKTSGSSKQSGTGSIKVSQYNQGNVDEKYLDPNYNPYATIPASSKGKTVRFATWIDHYTTEGSVPLMKFEKDTGLKIALMTVPQGGYAEGLRSKIASGDIPDVFVTNDDNSGFPILLDFAAPVNKVSSVDLKDPIWDQSMLKVGTVGGNVYFLNTLNSPWSGSNLTYYNKALYEENGFKTPAEYYEEGKWTWETAAKVMKEVKGLGEGYEGAYVEQNILTGAFGASFTKYDYKTQTFSSGVKDPKLTEAYQWYVESKQAGLIGATYANNRQLFKEGKIGMVFTGVYGLKTTGHWKDMDFDDIGFTYLPAINESTPAMTSSIWRNYGIVDGAPNADAAGYFIRYWLDYQNYNLDIAFINTDAGNFYYDLINKTADKKYFNHDNCTSLYLGTGSYQFIGPASASPTKEQVSTKINSVANLVNQAVTEANKVIQKKIAADRNR